MGLTARPRFGARTHDRFEARRGSRGLTLRGRCRYRVMAMASPNRSGQTRERTVDQALATRPGDTDGALTP